MNRAPALLCCALCCLAAVDTAAAQVRYVDVTADAGIRFKHTDGRIGRKYLPETLGSGAAFLDYDGDGDIDLYVVNAADLPGVRSPSRPTNALYRNDGSGHFEDVTAEAGVGDPGYGVGCAVADYDNDGLPDIFVTNYGANTLYHNAGDGTFTDVTDHAGVGDTRWGTSCAFLDVDRDGLLDLYVVNYMEFSTDENRRWETNGVRTYASPVDQIAGSAFVGERDILYRNSGDGTFEDQGRQVGLRDPRAGMGMAIGDPDNDGDSDYFMSYFSLETNGMFENLRIMYAGGKPSRLRFASHEDYWGLGDGSYGYVGWGTGFFDYDLDGDEDLYIAHGHVADLIEPLGKIGPQRNSLFLNLLREEGTVRFMEITDRAGPAWNAKLYCSRGAAVADYDNDGDPDLIVANMQDPIQLLRNDTKHNRRWLKVKLKGAGKNTEALGAFVTVEAGDLKLRKPVYSGAAYLSTDDRTILYGLGDAKAVDRVVVRWPDGKTKEIPGAQVELDSLLVVREGA